MSQKLRILREIDLPRNGIRRRVFRRKYVCDKCGACCSGTLFVEVMLHDIEREPRVVEGAADVLRGKRTPEEVVASVRAVCAVGGRLPTRWGSGTIQSQDSQRHLQSAAHGRRRYHVGPEGQDRARQAS